jgi:hypothetical protein
MAGDLAYAQFMREFDRLCVVAGERVRVEWSHRHRQDLRRLSRELAQPVLEYGRPLRVVFRHRLTARSRQEAAWYLATLRARGSHQDAFALVPESWIVAIQGLIKPPGCNELTAPLQGLRDTLPELAQAARSRDRVALTPQIEALVRTVTGGGRCAVAGELTARTAQGKAGQDGRPVNRRLAECALSGQQRVCLVDLPSGYAAAVRGRKLPQLPCASCLPVARGPFGHVAARQITVNRSAVGLIRRSRFQEARYFRAFCARSPRRRW